MRLLALMVTRNEADRYLIDSLLWHFWMFDGIAIYDDQSTDATVSIAKEYGTKIRVRSDDEPSFLEHEGNFRQNSWRWLTEAFNPTQDDWVFSIDADEFFLGNASELYDAAVTAAAFDHVSVDMERYEVFDIENNIPLIRVDGYWPHQRLPRLCRWLPTFSFPDRVMASGCMPLYARHNPFESELQLLHYGYARPEDRQEKFDRYIDLPGHNKAHIRSILETPKLIPWEKRSPVLR